MIPDGATINYASPEVLQSGQYTLEGWGANNDSDYRKMLVNGPAADTWSAGIVMFKVLTGQLPFELKPGFKHPMHSGGAAMPERLQKRWEEHEDMLCSHAYWVSTANLGQARLTPQLRRFTADNHSVQ